MRVESINAARACGFSLLEMLVALAIFSMVVLGLLNLTGENTRAAVIIEERTLANVVAENHAIAVQLATAQEWQQLLSQPQGRDTLGDRDWDWRITPTATAGAALVKVDVIVMAAGEERIAAEVQLFRSAR